MRISELARRGCVNIETIRFYERRGILPEPARLASGYRDYDDESVRMVRFIKRAQKLGFTLAEVRELLDLRDSRQASCREVREAATAKIDDIKAKIRDLRRMNRALEELVTSCRGAGATPTCPILQSLDGSDRRKRRR